MKILITGGAGFIGVNCAQYFSQKGDQVVIFDNLSRIGSDLNLKWIENQCKVDFYKGDLRNLMELVDVFKKYGKFDLILHLAAQVAVTTSVDDPRTDFEINALGTFNLLEATRRQNPDTTIIYASTNKVYGEMLNLRISSNNGRYAYKKKSNGIDENQILDFHSPYGCSKGAADQYCRDYFRIYGINTIVFRQSCIYGYRQFGIEDQGWVAWFCIAAALGKNITIFGDGKQVRDILFIDDLVRAFELGYNNRHKIAGKVFNIGGGPNNTLSLNELVQQLRKHSGQDLSIKYDNWRPGDQKIFIGDISLAKKEFGWEPKIGPIEGTEMLYNWVNNNKALFN